MGVVYKHTLNDKSYIGYTKYDMDERLRQHITNANRKTKKSHFANAIRKYGEENIVSDILFECDDVNKLKEMEIYFIEKYDTFKNGYNNTAGGDGGNITGGVPLTEEHRRKISVAQKGKPKKNKGRCGKYKKSEEHKEKLSKSIAGRIWVSNHETGLEHQIKEDDLEYYLNQGYVKGRGARDFSNDKRQVNISDSQKKQLSEIFSKRIHICHPEEKSKFVTEEDYISIYKEKGYQRGRKCKQN